ncbi:rhomboid family intramembrane serine protease [Deinococcus piscis]|uniref:Rhomboid family intramembrane serine protease n=1 Tax=Deinococcus piscis TaxID=394230 RepID=A0ABQ3K096_9DEIO|nr:rhomboid family intramembrane serine protease [Deinococcus piscis]GHF98167.1 rhomboid family intramembrane serine protease [Deinococcus piscis]
MTRSPVRPRPAPPSSPVKRPQTVSAALVTALLIGLIWIQEFIDQLLPGLRLDNLGIWPRDSGSWWHIFTAPFLHGGWGHLIANTVPLATLAFMSAVRSVQRFLAATFIITLVGGGLIWLLARGGSVHLGASILIFGYFAYLLGVGWWERTPAAIGVAVIAAVLYGGILWGVLPTDPRISFEGHLFGFIGGLVAAAMLHRPRPPRSLA